MVELREGNLEPAAMAEQLRRSPRRKLNVTWRGTTKDKVLFDCEDGTVLELLLQPKCYQNLCETMGDFQRDAHLGEMVQSPKSSAIPHSDGSKMPGQSQLPPVNSSSATKGE